MASEASNDTQSMEVTADDYGTDSITDRLNRTCCVIRYEAFHDATAEVVSEPLRNSELPM